MSYSRVLQILSNCARRATVCANSPSFAVAQNNLGELLDAGAKKLSGDEFREEIVQHTVVGPLLTSPSVEMIFASGGTLQGRTQNLAGTMQGANIFGGYIDGVWTIDDKGRVCSSLSFGRTMLPFRCQYWFKYKDDYFVADFEDRNAKVVRRTVKQ